MATAFTVTCGGTRSETEPTSRNAKREGTVAVSGEPRQRLVKDARLVTAVSPFRLAPLERQEVERARFMRAAWYAAATRRAAAAVAVPRAPENAGSTPATAVAARSGHSDAWWHGVAICEQGGRNDPYFGYFSYMDGSEGGGKSWAEQVARGNQTIAQYGDHAWAQQCINAGYAASPGG